MSLKVINRSQETYDQLTVANYTDFDIGGFNDDFVGSSSAKNMIFGYNGDNLDNSTIVSTFGVNPPSCGIKLLNHQIDVAGFYNNGGGAQSDPASNADFWNYMNGRWSDGSSFTFGGNGYGGTTPTQFLYDGNPNNLNAWTEVSAQNTPGDRRGFITATPIDNFAPGDFICYDYAILYSRTGGNNLLNVNGLFDVADNVQSFYDSQAGYFCEPSVVGIDESSNKGHAINIYPNPAKHQFRVMLSGSFNIEIHDMSGKLIQNIEGINSNQDIEAPTEPGIYLITIHQKEEVNTQKLVIQ